MEAPAEPRPSQSWRRVAPAGGFRRWYPAVVFVAAVVALMPNAITGRATYVAVDVIETTSPYRDHLERPPRVVSPAQTDHVEHLPLTLKFVDELRDGNWQLWDPAVGAGTPTATAFPWLVSPFNLVYLVLPGWYATTLDAALTLLVGQVLTFLLIRRLGASRAASTFGAVAYAFTGANMAFIQRPFGAVWVLPGLLWAISRAMDRPSVPRSLLVGGFVAWCWFEGFPAVFAYSIYTAVAWSVWLAARRLRRLRADGEPLSVAARAVAGRLAATGGGFVWGVLVAMITLLPFVDEVQGRGLLDLRTTNLHSHLPSFYVWSIFDLKVNGDPLDLGSVWGGVHPFESITMVGSIVLAAAFTGLVVPRFTRRLRLAPAGRDAWPFFALLPAVLAFLVFVGTRLLGWVYLVPGIASNPLHRSRFLIGLGFAVLAALHLDHMLGRVPRREGEAIPASAQLAAAACWCIIAVVTGDDLVRAAWRAAQGREMLGGVLVGVGFVVVAGLVVWLARSHALPNLGAVALAGLVFLQVAYPLRNFTPESPVEDFYPETAGHRELERLGGGRYRFAASASNFYFNSAQLLDLYDLRGIVLYGRELRAMLQSASPETFRRDPLKQVLVRDEWDLASPVYDDLALRHFALATSELPFGQQVTPATDWTSWAAATDVTGHVELPPGRELAALALPLRHRGNCDHDTLTLEVLQGDRVVASSRRPAYDAAGGWLWLAVVGSELSSGSADIRVSADEPCQLEVGVTGGRAAVQMMVEDPADGVRLVSTEQAWIYERPGARPLVSTHTDWGAFTERRELLHRLQNRPPAEANTAFLLGSGEPSKAAGTATIHQFDIDDDVVTAVAESSSRALVVLAQADAPGWTVTVDGEDRPMESVDGALMGVFVEPGRHDVRFEYRPRNFVVGAATTGFALALGVLLAMWSRKRSRCGATEPRLGQR